MGGEVPFNPNENMRTDTPEPEPPVALGTTSETPTADAVERFLVDQASANEGKARETLDPEAQLALKKKYGIDLKEAEDYLIELHNNGRISDDLFNNSTSLDDEALVARVAKFYPKDRQMRQALQEQDLKAKPLREARDSELAEQHQKAQEEQDIIRQQKGMTPDEARSYLLRQESDNKIEPNTLTDTLLNDNETVVVKANEVKEQQIQRKANQIREALSKKTGIAVEEIDTDLAYSFASLVLEDNPEDLSNEELAAAANKTVDQFQVEMVIKLYTDLLHKKVYSQTLEKLTKENGLVSQQLMSQQAEAAAKEAENSFMAKTPYYRELANKEDLEAMVRVAGTQFGQLLGNQLGGTVMSFGKLKFPDVVMLLIETMAGK
jgi:hypothetical protein